MTTKGQDQLSPGMKQYLAIKEQYQDAFLLFRMGDFYELFYEDAVKAAQILELTLTSRNKNADNPIPMAGVPFHVAQNYIDLLVEQGYKVAIAEQMEDPKTTKGVVKREVVQVVTPGTAVASSSSSATENNYLTALIFSDGLYGFAYADLSTGELKTTILHNDEEVINEATTLRTKEMVLGTPISLDLKEKLTNCLQIIFSEQREILENTEVHFLTQDLSAELELEVTKKLLSYLMTTQKRNLNHLQKCVHYQMENFLKMDYPAKCNLELTKSLKTGKKYGTLLWLLDKTKTAMGSRLLKQWIDRPLVSQAEIMQRQKTVQSLLLAYFERHDLQNLLKGVYDLERLAARVALGTINPRELLQLRNSLDQIPKIISILSLINVDHELDHLLQQLQPDNELVALINHAINDEAPISTQDGGIINNGYNEELDQYRKATAEGSQWILDLEQKERELTGIKTLRIDYNRKDGYYFNVTNSNLDKVDHTRYFRKSTLKNAERYGTEELERMQATILEASEKSAILEYELFLQVRNIVEEHIERLQRLAKGISELDVLLAFSQIAEDYSYVKPNLVAQGTEINIVSGRHPVVERVLDAGEYISNNLEMGQDNSMLLITGPNMSGKSTYMRQLALIAIMAQIGSYVPAKSATLPIFDRIFTRIGASDDLISGQSTFMVEMMEANSALQGATKQSLILFDELGRGTATYDGMALAQAIIEYIHNNIGAKTLFSTHYHELTILEEKLTGLRNVHVGAIEQNGDLVFLHKIEAGAADKSYGIHVAKIAGLPTRLLQQATHILNNLENQNTSSTTIFETSSLQVCEPNGNYLANYNQPQLDAEENEISFSATTSKEEQTVLDRIRNLDMMAINPMEAFNILVELKKKLENLPLGEC